MKKTTLGKEIGDSKPIYSLLFISLFLARTSENEDLYFPKDNIVVLCSNYDKLYQKKRRWGPLSSLDDLEEHSMSLDDPRAVAVASPPLK